MGGSNAYCALCGVLESRPRWDQDPEELVLEPGESLDDCDPLEYDPQLVRYEDAEWMLDTRIIGENLASSEADRTFIAGPSIDISDGVFNTRPGHHPDYPTPEPGYNYIWSTLYDWDSGYGVVIPFHYVCYDVVFRSMVKHRTGADKIDNMIWYETMKEFCPRSDDVLQKLESLDYHAVSHCQDQYFSPDRGTEAFVSFPGPCQAVADVYDNLSQSEVAVQVKWSRQALEASSAGCFSVLPTEIVLDIMTNLPFEALTNLRACSRQLYTIYSASHFWRRKFKLDLPWTYDMPEAVWQKDIDWAGSYQTLHLGTLKYNERLYLNLANRRRIWEICEPLIEEYLTRLRAKQKMLDGANDGK